jgi:hypothetical protein
MDGKIEGKSSEEQTPLAPTLPRAEVKYPYTDSEKVYIFPKQRNSVLPEKGTTMNSAATYTSRIGSAWAGPTSSLELGRTILSLEEERAYMSQIVGVAPTAERWETILNEYWRNLSIIVDYDGLELEIGFIHNSATTKTPISVRDYVLYRYCLKYYDVANHKSEVEKSKKIRFYMEKPSEIKKARIDLQELKDLAISARLEFQKDSNRVKALLAVKDLPYQDAIDMRIALADYAEQHPEEFISLIKDKDLLTRGLIMTMIRRGILQKPNDSNVILNKTEPIGGNLDEAVAFFNDAANGATISILQAKLKDTKK